MRTILIKCAEFALLVSLIAAVQPYLDFLFSPSPEQARRWMFTVMALGIAGALHVALRYLRAPQ